MKVKNLEVEAFRNLKNFNFIPCDTVNIICGDNAQGKTNLLEAIWLFTGSRSFRATRERDFLPHDRENAGLSFDFYSGGREQNASVRWASGKRQIMLNGIKQDNFSDFSGVFCGVIFSPDHLSLVKDGPENRRQMIDTSLTQAYPKYSLALSNYQKALKQRNTLLKDLKEHPSLIDLLGLWDDHVVEYGGYISALRDRYIRRLAVYAEEIYGGISGGKEKFNLEYIPSYGKINSDGFELEDFRDALRQSLEDSRAEDLKFGVTNTGPQRDDIDIQINDLSARNFGSQGQQRSSVLAIKLAECMILEEQNGESPVIMLDDVMSELDHNRRSYLLNKLSGKQVVITCCDMSAFDNLEKGKIFTVSNGLLTSQHNKGDE